MHNIAYRYREESQVMRRQRTMFFVCFDLLMIAANMSSPSFYLWSGCFFFFFFFFVASNLSFSGNSDSCAKFRNLTKELKEVS